MAPWLSEKTSGGDSYQATLHAMDEAVRNAVCVGADPSRIAILDNFCWPSCDDPRNMGSLVRAAQACFDGAMAYRVPFVSGKDSLHNQLTTEDGKLITIPPTLLVTALGIVPDVRRARTMDAKHAGNVLLVVGVTTPALGGSHLSQVTQTGGGHIPAVDLVAGPKHAKAVALLIRQGLTASVHDCSDGGLLCAAAEMAFAGRIGLDLDLSSLPVTGECSTAARCFAESPSRYLLEVEPGKLDAVFRSLRDAGVPFGQVGTFATHDRLTVRTAERGRLLDVELSELLSAWQATLDW
jgi:phosphoribosylformylglycinamidine synthase